MAVRIDGSADYVGRSASLPSPVAVTMAGWANMQVDRNNFSSLCCLTASPGTNGQLCLQTANDGTSINVWFDSGSIAVQEPASGYSAAVATPFFWALTCGGTAAGDIKAYFRTRGSNVFNTSFSSATGLAATYTPVLMRFGNADTSEFWNGDIWNIKVWDRALTAKELLVESFYERVQYPASLHAHYLLRGAVTPIDDTVDYSGNARTPTFNGALATAPVPGNYGMWRARRQRFIHIVGGGGGPQLIDVAQTTETDSVLALTRSKTKAIGLTTETDSAQVVRPNRLKVVSLVTETDSAQAVGWTKAKAVGINTETDTAQAVTANRPISVGLTAETDTAQSVGRTKARAVGINSEADSALAAAAQRSYPAGLTTETDTAQAVTHTKAKEVGLVQETDEAQAVGTGDSLPVAFVSETDSAFAVGWIKVKAVGLATSADTALPCAHTRARGTGLAEEADTALPVSRAHLVQVGLALEQAEAFALTFLKARGIGLAIELDEALPVEQPDKLLDPAAYFPVSVAGQSPPTFQVSGEGPSHAKLFNV